MFEHLFGSKTRLKLLRLFFNSPEEDFYGRELARMTGNQLNSVRRELNNLAAVGVIYPTEPRTDLLKPTSSRSKYYRLNVDCGFFYELKDLLARIQMAEEKEIIEEIKEKAGQIKVFLLTGIFTQTDKTDADILLVGKLKPQVVDKLMKKFEKIINHEIRYSLLTEEEFDERCDIGDKFLYTLFDAKHFMAVGQDKIE